MKEAVFGGGCFWCTEAVFKMLNGVHSVVPGYAGGSTENPSYETVCSGTTGHAEVIRVRYEPEEISFRDLLTVFFATHDSTQLNRQGNDVGTQYRSVIFYTDEQQKNEAQAFIQEVQSEIKTGEKITTEVAPLSAFYEAEGYHHDYFKKNPDQAYCQIIIGPKLEKVEKRFTELLKHQYA